MVAPNDGFYKEDNFQCKAEPAFVTKCTENWQQECRITYMHNEDLRAQLCETHLDRNYVKIRTFIPPTQILDQVDTVRNFDLSAYFTTSLGLCCSGSGTKQGETMT